MRFQPHASKTITRIKVSGRSNQTRSSSSAVLGQISRVAAVKDGNQTVNWRNPEAAHDTSKWFLTRASTWLKPVEYQLQEVCSWPGEGPNPSPWTDSLTARSKAISWGSRRTTRRMPSERNPSELTKLPSRSVIECQSTNPSHLSTVTIGAPGGPTHEVVTPRWLRRNRTGVNEQAKAWGPSTNS